MHPPSLGVVVSHGVCGTGVRCHQCPDLHPALPHPLPTSRLGWGAGSLWPYGHVGRWPQPCQLPAPLVTLAGGLSPPVGTPSTPRGGHNTPSLGHGLCQVCWHSPPASVCSVPRAQAVLYLIDQLIISSIQPHIGFRRRERLTSGLGVCVFKGASETWEEGREIGDRETRDEESRWRTGWSWELELAPRAQLQ